MNTEAVPVAIACIAIGVGLYVLRVSFGRLQAKMQGVSRSDDELRHSTRHAWTAIVAGVVVAAVALFVI